MKQDIIQKRREQVISQFEGITIDMNYLLCIPSVHAIYQGEEIIVAIDGSIRKASGAFPQEKAELVKRWVSIHRDEIKRNHLTLGFETEPLLMISPLEE